LLVAGLLGWRFGPGHRVRWWRRVPTRVIGRRRRLLTRVFGWWWRRRVLTRVIGRRRVFAGMRRRRRHRARAALSCIGGARVVETLLERGVARRLRWLQRLHAGVCLVVASFVCIGSCIGRGSLAGFLRHSASAGSGVQGLLGGLRCLFAHLALILAGRDRGPATVGCIAACIELMTAVVELPRERIVGRAYVRCRL
jgi:hypothetical protein